jgi:flagellar basal body-associated protein FliL
MVDNDSSVIDDYGNRNGWVEIFNKSQGTVNLGGCYLSDDRNNLTKSIIPKGDLKTKLGPRQVELFYASGDKSQGTFYMGFRIRKGSTLYLNSNDGRTLVDSIDIPASLPADMSVSKIPIDKKKMVFVTYGEPTKPTPMSLNESGSNETKSQKMAREDPYGLILTVVSIMVVFSALIILWFLYGTSGDIFQGKHKRKKRMSGKNGNENSSEIAAAISMALDAECNGEVYAAIAMALDKYQENTVHDMESYVITIKTGKSEWSSGQLSFRQLPK